MTIEGLAFGTSMYFCKPQAFFLSTEHECLYLSVQATFSCLRYVPKSPSNGGAANSRLPRRLVTGTIPRQHREE